MQKTEINHTFWEKKSMFVPMSIERKLHIKQK